MCTWAPTPRSWRPSAPPSLRGGAGRPVRSSSAATQPIAIEPAAWRARARAPEVDGYLGSERAEDVIRALDKLRPLEVLPEAGVLNPDLFPRDEFLSP